MEVVVPATIRNSACRIPGSSGSVGVSHRLWALTGGTKPPRKRLAGGLHRQRRHLCPAYSRIDKRARANILGEHLVIIRESGSSLNFAPKNPQKKEPGCSVRTGLRGWAPLAFGRWVCQK